VFGSFLNDGFGGKNQPKHETPKDICINVDCTLSEFYNGSVKTLNYQRKKVYPDGRTLFEVDE